MVSLTELDAILCAQFKRRAIVEDYLMRAGKGLGPLPDKEKCAELAALIGVPNEHRIPGAGK